MTTKLTTIIFIMFLMGCCNHDQRQGNELDIGLLKVELEAVMDLDAIGYQNLRIIYPNTDLHVFPPKVIDDTLILRFEDYKALRRYVTYAGWKNAIVLQPNLEFKRIMINDKYITEDSEIYKAIMKIRNTAQQGVAPEPVIHQKER